MPASSKRQLRLIYAKRKHYKTMKNTPKNWKWIWEEGWTKVDVKKLPQKVEESFITKFDDFVNEGVKDYLKPKSDEDLNKSLEKLTPEQKFFKGCEHGILSWVKDTIKDGVNPTCSENSGIVIASEEGHIDIVKYLLKNEKVDPSDQNNNAIFFAIDYDRYDVVKLLLSDERVKNELIKNNELKYVEEYFEKVRKSKTVQDILENSKDNFNIKKFESFIMEKKDDKLQKVMSVEKIAKKHNFDEKELKKYVKAAMKIERTHTDDVEIAENTILKNLEESPTYYHDKIGQIEMNKLLKKIEEQEKQEKREKQERKNEQEKIIEIEKGDHATSA